MLTITQESFNESLTVFRANRLQPDYVFDDCERFIYVIKDKFGITISMESAREIWEWESEMMCASWLVMESDDGIAFVFDKFVRNFTEECVCAETSSRNCPKHANEDKT